MIEFVCWCSEPES